MKQCDPVFACVLLIVASCAPQASQRDAASYEEGRIEIKRTMPTCKEARECEVKWAAARKWVLDHSAYKIQHITDDYIETYNPQRYSTGIAVRVRKDAISSGGYRFLVDVWCDNSRGCQPDSQSAAISFNRTVNSAYRTPTGRSRTIGSDCGPKPKAGFETELEAQKACEQWASCAYWRTTSGGTAATRLEEDIARGVRSCLEELGFSQKPAHWWGDKADE